MSFNNDSFLGGRTARLHYVLKLLLITAIMVLLTVRVANIEYQEAIEYEEGLQTLHEKVRCLADEPSEEFTLAMRSLQATGLGISKRIDRPPTLLIDTYFHIVLAEGQREKGIVSNAMVEAQFAELYSRYRAEGISLLLVSTTFTTNTTWATNGDDHAMKTALRQGSYSSLNIYFQSQLASDPLSPATTQFLGFSTMPDASGSNSSYTLDGCNVHAGTMPGGYVTGNNLGRTAVHEVGHWFGLLHTFHGNSCEGEGDLIDDTRQEKTSTSGCPVGKNTCPELEGVDPISNFMDYSSDECYEGFSAGQQRRIFETFALFRSGL